MVADHSVHPSIESQITFLYTADLSKTARFYEDTIGLPLVLDQGVCRIYRITQHVFLGFCEHTSRVPAVDSVIFTLVTPEVETWYDFLSARGVQFEKAPALNDKYQIYHCFFRDPNGYLLEIQRFTDPRWAATNTG